MVMVSKPTIPGVVPRPLPVMAFNFKMTYNWDDDPKMDGCG